MHAVFNAKQRLTHVIIGPWAVGFAYCQWLLALVELLEELEWLLEDGGIDALLEEDVSAFVVGAEEDVSLFDTEPVNDCFWDGKLDFLMLNCLYQHLIECQLGSELWAFSSSLGVSFTFLAR